MPVATGIQSSVPGYRKMAVSVLLRIKLPELQLSLRDICQKGNVMLFAHLMRYRYMINIICAHDLDSVLCVLLFCLKRWKGNPAAAHHRLSDSVDHISSDRAQIPSGTAQISRDIPVVYPVTGHQFYDGNIQRARKRLQKRYIRQSFSCSCQP